jgi:SAM-dependent methyltransferase
VNTRFTLISLFLTAAANAQLGPLTPPPAPPPPPATPQPTPTQPAETTHDHSSEIPADLPAVEVMRFEASKLRRLVHNPEVERFLVSVTWLPVVEDGRTIYVEPVKGGLPKRALSEADYNKLPQAEREGLKADRYNDHRFYYTRYGTPLAYCRPLDLVAEHADGDHPFRYRKILDFGYGTIGHLRLLASIGNTAVGVDVDPTLKALYSNPDDTGIIKGVGLNDIMNDGSLALYTGHWPGDKDLAAAIGGDYDLIISKNTLKNGYINPEQPVDKKLLVDLGVPSEEFVSKVAAALKPGGLFMIYNICPAQKPKDQGYIPWADGRSPFPKEMLEKAGLKVLSFNTDDTPAIRELAKALGWDEGQSPMDLEHDLFATYTLAQKPKPDSPSKPAPAPAKPK